MRIHHHHHHPSWAGNDWDNAASDEPMGFLRRRQLPMLSYVAFWFSWTTAFYSEVRPWIHRLWTMDTYWEPPDRGLSQVVPGSEAGEDGNYVLNRWEKMLSCIRHSLTSPSKMGSHLWTVKSLWTEHVLSVTSGCNTDFIPPRCHIWSTSTALKLSPLP